MTTEETGTTLRETISQAVDAEERKVASEPEVKDAVIAPEKVEAKVEEPKDGRTAGRARNEKGQLLPGKAEKAPEVSSVEAQAPEVKRPARPSSWKKDYWEHWDKLDPKLNEYLLQREDEYAKGVSTYKGEYDRLKPVDEALRPYAPFLQQAQMKPEQFVAALAQSDQTLRYGNPQEKLRMFARLATDYQIPLHEMLVQGEDGKVYLNQQYFQQQQQQQAQGITAQDVERMVQQKLAVAQWQAAVQGFIGSRDKDGNPSYPHFEAVKATMDGILRAGLAKDLPSAYDAALRMPQHSDLFDAQQKQQRESEAAAAAKAKADAAARARANSVSTKSSSPTGTRSSASGAKSLRETIAEAVNAAESSRV